MNLDNVVVILSHPEESRNVGAACRAMANSALTSLRIVGRKEDLNETQVRTLALHAGGIFDAARFFPSITDAAADAACVCATTRRRGKRRKGKLLLPGELAALADRITGTRDAAGGRIAVVFGPERCGLSDSEINECNLAVTIPADERFASLNLSHAVQIIGYTLFSFTSKQKTGYVPIEMSRLEDTVKTISGDLKKVGFFSTGGERAREGTERFWRDILSRAALSEGEAAYIEKTFTKIAGLTGSRQP